MTDFRFGNERVVDPAGFGIHVPRVRFGPPAPHRHHWLIRPDDLLVFDVGWVNLKLEPGEGEAPAHLVRKGPGEAFLIVTLPPQHVTEIAYFTTAEEFEPKITLNPTVLAEIANLAKGEALTPNISLSPEVIAQIANLTLAEALEALLPDDLPETDEPLDDPPIKAIIAGWSRLVFKVPNDAQPIEWTSEGVLEALRGLELNVAANALPPRPPLREFMPGIGVQTEANIVAMAAGELPPAASAGPATVRAFARARRGQRTSLHALGLVDLPASAALGSIMDVVGPEAFIRPELFRPKPAPPGSNETAIELPWRLLLSPSRQGAWFHSPSVVSGETGRTELWHTRLGSRDNGDIVPVDPKRTLRAIWALSPPGYQQVNTPSNPSDEVDVPVQDDTEPFRASLNEHDRHNVVHLSSNFRLRKPPPSKGFFEPDPLDVDHMALSSLGGWLDSRGAWEAGAQPLGLEVEEWRHRATLGRDHFVRIVITGRLFPLGHRASLVKVTERRFEPSKAGNPAYLRQRKFIIVREPLRTYRQSGWTFEDLGDPRDGERWDLKLPFTAMRITTRVSPLIDPPENHGADPSDPQGAFWPYVKGKPFCFGVVATDLDGRPVPMSMPLIFVGQDATDEDYAQSIVPTSVVAAYQEDTWPSPGNGLLAKVPVGGQLVAWAESDAPDDTTFATQTITFGAEVPAEEAYDKLPPRSPRFLPVVRTAQLDVPALQKIAGTTAAADLVYDTTYLHNGFQGENGGQVFLARDPAKPALGVPFSKQSARSGGFVAPDLSLSGLSRITGPVSGDIETAAKAASMDPAVWFKDVLDGAQLFGVLSLADIIEEAKFWELDKLPRLAGGALDQVQKLVADMERLHTLLQGIPDPQVANVDFLLNELVDPVNGSMADLFTSGDSATVLTQLTLLKGELANLPAAIAGSSLTAGPRAVVSEAAEALDTQIADLGNAAEAAELINSFANGDLLPEDISARFEWRPVLKKWPSATPIFIPKGDTPYRNLLLSVEASGDSMTVTCSLDSFDLDLVVLILEFERVQFRSRAGQKPEVDVAFTKFSFAGPLSFIETLRQLIPLDGFSDPPEVSVTTEGITAGFTMNLPNIAFGVFSLENLSLGAGFTIPFIGPPMSTWFRFCERENPSRLTVMMFGGGFFFGVTVDAKGLQVAEGAIEFGAAISVDFGVASGSVSAMAGLYFKIESGDVTLAGYFRLRGEVEALGIVSVSIELYLEMKYESGSGKCVGTATISIDIDVTLLSTSIEISCSKKFAGSGPDPTLAEMFDVGPNATSADWNLYCGAFA